MDRASGSGVFARDPDALLDLIELEATDAIKAQEENKAACRAIIRYLDAHFLWQDDVGQDDRLSERAMRTYCQEHLDKWQMDAVEREIEAEKKLANGKTAWRIEGILREFAKFEPVNIWFNYPVHAIDDVGCLQDIQPEAEKPAYQKAKEARKKQGEVQRAAKKKKYQMAVENFRFENDGKYPTVKELFEQLKSDAEAVGEKYPSEKTVRNSLKGIGYELEKDTGRLCPVPEEA